MCINPEITMNLAFIIFLINKCYPAVDQIGIEGMPFLNSQNSFYILQTTTCTNRVESATQPALSSFHFTQQLFQNVYQASKPHKGSRIAVGTLNGVWSEIECPQCENPPQQTNSQCHCDCERLESV
jgi:hypothetical protein